MDLTTLTELQIDTELSQSISDLKAKGLNVENIVYPYNAYSATILEYVRKYYKCGIGYEVGTKSYNNEPINQYGLYRITLEHNLASTNKVKIDEAISKKAWIIFMAHGKNYNPTFYPEGTQPLDYIQMLQNAKDNIDYLVSQGVEVVTVKQALDKIENVITIGDEQYSDNYLFVGKNGGIKSKSIPNVSSGTVDPTGGNDGDIYFKYV